MKRFIYLSIVISACLACTCCSVKDPNDHAICRLYFFPTSSSYPFYCIEVTDSQTVRTTSGMQSSIKFEDMLMYNERLYPYRDSIIADKTQYKEYHIDENGKKIWHEEKFRQKEHRISDKDYARLKEEIKKVKKMEEINEFENTGYNDANGYIILIDDRQYIMVEDPKGKGFEDLMRQIMKASPIEILDHFGNPPYLLR